MNVQEITLHAVQRASERLGLSRETFTEWAHVTCPHWIQVNAAYLFDRGVAVTQKSRLFITPWVEGHGVALVCSEDHAVKTVIPYADSRYAINARRDLHTMALMKAAAERGDEADRLLSQFVRGPIAGPALEEALGAYVDGLLSLEDLGYVLRTRHAYRHRALQSHLGSAA